MTGSYISQINLVNTFQLYFSEAHINILPSTPRSSGCSLLFEPHLPSACYLPFSCNVLWFYHPNDIWWRVQITEHFNMQFSPASCHVTSPYILSSTQLSNSLYQRSPRNSRDKVSHPYITTAKIIVLYILYFMLVHVQEVKRFWTPWYPAFAIFNLFLISSWMQFWFVTVGPKYLNWYLFQYIPNRQCIR
jgi:hypothetical protein